MTIEDYLATLPPERREAFSRLRAAIKESLPPGFAEEVGEKTVGYVVPHAIYPKGYHCDPKRPLPFIDIGSNRDGLVLYHMGLYADQDLKSWFAEEYAKISRHRIDMSKSCINFKHLDEIPFDLIRDLSGRMSVERWIGIYESRLRA